MYAAIIATWTQALITAMTILTPIDPRLRDAETARRKDLPQGAAAIPVEAVTRPEISARREQVHRQQAVVLAFPRGGLVAIRPNTE